MRNSSPAAFVSRKPADPKNTKAFRKRHIQGAPNYITLLLAILFATPFAFAQGSPKVTSVDPAMGKVNDTVNVIGENLGKGSVSAVFLSDDKDDSKASVVEQAAGKITIK